MQENPSYEKFKTRGLQYVVELAELFGDVAASGQSEWAPSSNIPLGGNEQSRVNESEEGSGDSDEVIRGRTGLSGEFCSVTVGGSSGGNKHNVQGTSATDKSKGSGNMTTSSLGVKKRGAAKKKKGSAATKIAEALNMMAEEARVEREKDDARRAAAEARAYETSVLGVMDHLKQVPEVTCVGEFYKRCRRLLMRDQIAREVYVALKETKDQLLEFLRTECDGDD